MGGSKLKDIVGVRFKKLGKIYIFNPKKWKLKKGDKVIVETAQGEEFGEVIIPNRTVPEDKIVEPFGIHGDDRTVEYYKDRWNFLIENILNKEEINKIIDYQYEYLSKANSLSRENIRNSNLELKKNVNQEEEIIKLKEWYEKRIDVINDYIESL